MIDGKGTIVFMENDNGRIRAIAPYTFNNFAVTNVSAASYLNAPSASESIVAAFGTSLATGAYPALRIPLATSLGGTTVKVKDSAGLERLAPLFYVSPGQVNYQVPYGTTLGSANVTITSSDGKTSNGSIQISSIAPGIFSATSDGAGWAAANIQRVKADGSQVVEPVVRYDTQQNKFVPVPINLSNANELAYLVLYGTGIRNRNSLMNVTAKIAGLDMPVEYAGPHCCFVGVDQINIKLPLVLRGRGEIPVVLSVDGKVANTVLVNFQ